MKKAAAALLLVLGATACHGSTKLAANPGASSALNADEARAQAIVQKCAAHANFLTKPGRKAFYGCVAPKGESAAVQTCTTTALARDGVLTKAARQKFEADVASCIVPKGGAK